MINKIIYLINWIYLKIIIIKMCKIYVKINGYLIKYKVWKNNIMIIFKVEKYIFKTLNRKFNGIYKWIINITIK